MSEIIIKAIIFNDIKKYISFLRYAVFNCYLFHFSNLKMIACYVK